MGVWEQTTIAGKTADIFLPSRVEALGTRPGAGGVVIFLHGHGMQTLAEKPVFTEWLDRFGLRTVCPHGKRSWWGEKVCAEFDPEISPAKYVRENVLGWIAETWDVTPPAIALLGVSMGGQGALKLAYRRPQDFPIVVALSPAVDFQIWHGRGLPLDEMYPTPESARQDTATLQLHPLNWPRNQLITCDPSDEDWFEGAERLISKLSSTGIPFESDLATMYGGHSWDYFNHMAPRAMTYIRDRLEQERNRLPTVRR